MIDGYTYVSPKVVIGHERLICTASPLGPKKGLVACEDHGWIAVEFVELEGVQRAVCSKCIRQHCEIGWCESAT